MAKRKKSASVRVSIRLPESGAQVLAMMERHTGWSQSKCIWWALSAGSLFIAPDAKTGTGLCRLYAAAQKVHEAKLKAEAIVAKARAEVRSGKVKRIKFSNGGGQIGVLAADLGAPEVRPGD